MVNKVGRWTCCLLIMLAASTSVGAETTTDVYRALGVPTKTLAEEQELKIKKLNVEYTDKLDEYTSAVDYNAVINNLDIESVKDEYSYKLLEYQDKAEEISEEGYYLSLNELNTLYTEYRDLQREVNNLAVKIKKYENWKPKSIPDYDLDGMYTEIEEEKETLASFRAASEVGEVSTLFNFIQAEYVVKHKFDGAGVLYRTRAGTGILSVFSGTCVYSDRDDVLGEVIKVDSGDGIIITYTGLRSRYVQEGDVVKQYQKIAATNENIYVILEVCGVAYDIDLLYGGKLEVGQTS